MFYGVIYGVTASLGFAALENVLYVLDTGLTTAGVRAWTAIPPLYNGNLYGTLLRSSQSRGHVG